MQFILHHLEERYRLGTAGIVVDTSRVKVEDLPVHDLFGRADVPDTVEKFLPIVSTAKFLQPLVIHRKTLDDVLLQPFGRPSAETGGDGGLDPIAKRNDHVEVVMRYEVVLAVCGSCSEFPNN